MASGAADGPLWTSIGNLKQVTRFHELLGQLCSEHDQEVTMLRQELVRFHRQSPQDHPCVDNESKEEPEIARSRSPSPMRNGALSPGSEEEGFSDMEEEEDRGSKPLGIVPEAPILSPPCSGPAPPPGPPPGLRLPEDPVNPEHCGSSNLNGTSNPTLHNLLEQTPGKPRLSSTPKRSSLQRPRSPHPRKNSIRRSQDNGRLPSPRCSQNGPSPRCSQNGPSPRCSQNGPQDIARLTSPRCSEQAQFGGNLRISQSGFGCRDSVLSTTSSLATVNETSDFLPGTCQGSQLMQLVQGSPAGSPRGSVCSYMMATDTDATVASRDSLERESLDSTFIPVIRTPSGRESRADNLGPLPAFSPQTPSLQRHRSSLCVVAGGPLCSRDSRDPTRAERSGRRGNIVFGVGATADDEESPPEEVEEGEDEEKDVLNTVQTRHRGSVMLVTTEAFSATDRFETSDKVKKRESTAGENHEIQLHPTWEELAQDFMEYGVPEAAGKLIARKSTHNMKKMFSMRDAFAEVINERCFDTSKIISSPSSMRRLGWDLLGIMFLCYDLLSVPLQVYQFEEHQVSKIGRFVTAVFWTIDIGGSFLVGYHRKGMVEMRPGRVACHYIKSWFILDLILVSSDWVIILLYGQTSIVRLGKFTRGMRAFRLLRLVKYHVLLADITTRIRSEYMRTILSIGKIITFIVFVNHFIACGFYGLHHLDSSGHTWVEKNFDDEAKALYRYWTSVHWSLTQFTPASMEVVPVNAVERMYTVCVLLFALVTFSSFVSSITTAMTHLRHCNARKIEQDSTLRRYLSEHDISPELTSRVLHYFQDRQQQNRRQVRTKEADVELFKVLPDSIKFELRIESFMPIMTSHPLFHQLQTLDLPAAKHICRGAVLEKRLTVHDELFGHGAEVTHMLFITEGLLNYKYPINSLMYCDKIHKGEWACEVALWANSCELFGPFVAESNCEMLMLDRTEFRAIAEKYPLSAGRAARYGELYIHEVKEVVKGCRWQSVVLNDFDQAQELSQNAFENEHAERNSGRMRHSGSSSRSGFFGERQSNHSIFAGATSWGLGTFFSSLGKGHGQNSNKEIDGLKSLSSAGSTNFSFGEGEGSTTSAAVKDIGSVCPSACPSGANSANSSYANLPCDIGSCRSSIALPPEVHSPPGLLQDRKPAQEKKIPRGRVSFMVE